MAATYSPIQKQGATASFGFTIPRQKFCLLLIVTFQDDAIEGPNEPVQGIEGVLRLQQRSIHPRLDGLHAPFLFVSANAPTPGSGFGVNRNASHLSPSLL